MRSKKNSKKRDKTQKTSVYIKIFVKSSRIVVRILIIGIYNYCS